MYSQFFGNYLLNNKLVTAKQLAEAMEIKSETRLKLGVLAINAGYMNASEVEIIHGEQQRVDKRFGDLAIERGYMTSEQVNKLLVSQKTGFLLLGQALVDKGYLTNAQFSNAISDYKLKYKIKNEDNFNATSDAMISIVSEFYHFGNASCTKTVTEYVSLLLKNIIRFIGDDFTPLEATLINNFKCERIISQQICGKFSAFTAVEAIDSAIAKFASRFAQEDLNEIDEYTTAAVGEFLNLHNGLFTVNMSNVNDVELELMPQKSEHNTVLDLKTNAFCIPIVFTFGTVNFIISTKN